MLNLGVVALEQGNTALGRESLTRFVAAAPAGLFASDIGRARKYVHAVKLRMPDQQRQGPRDEVGAGFRDLDAGDACR